MAGATVDRGGKLLGLSHKGPFANALTDSTPNVYILLLPYWLHSGPTARPLLLYYGPDYRIMLMFHNEGRYLAEHTGGEAVARNIR